MQVILTETEESILQKVNVNPLIFEKIFNDKMYQIKKTLIEKILKQEIEIDEVRLSGIKSYIIDNDLALVDQKDFTDIQRDAIINLI